MSIKFAMIKPSIWRRKFGNLSPDAKLLAIFLMTNEMVVMIGIYHIPIFNMSLGIGLDETRVRELLYELKENDICMYDEPSMFIWVKDMVLTQVGRSPNENQLKGVLAHITRLQEDEQCVFVKPFLERYKEIYSLPEFVEELNYSSLAYS